MEKDQLTNQSMQEAWWILDFPDLVKFITDTRVTQHLFLSCSRLVTVQNPPLICLSLALSGSMQMRVLRCLGVRIPSTCLVAMLGSQSLLLGLPVPLPGDHREKQEDTAGTILREEDPRGHATGPQENSPPHLRLLTSPFSRVPSEKHAGSLKSWTALRFCLLSLPSKRQNGVQAWGS